jgi:oxygen-independent coproporphyrinogen-3 oxidase
MSDDFPSEVLGDVTDVGMPAHFYFHVPFCRSKCAYCDFCSTERADPALVGAVFRGMEAEVRRWGFSALPGLVETVYVGGGTPSLFPEFVAHLLGHVALTLDVREGAEVTVEANPDSMTAGGIEALVGAGVSRVSVGVQAFDDAVLRTLGRVHDAKQAREALELVRNTGADLAIDLMCGIPGQGAASWAESIEEALDAAPAHVSVYPLSVEEGTPLAATIAGGVLPEPDPDRAAEMMLVAQERLARAGLVRYEVANYALPGHESRHNTAYWTGASYVGIGPGAHGMLQPDVARMTGVLGEDSGCPELARVRYGNAGDATEWLRGGHGEVECLSAEQVAREDVMLGMRMVRGVDARQVRAAGLDAVAESLAASGLLELEGGRWRTTSRGWLLGNEVFGRIWLGE